MIFCGMPPKYSSPFTIPSRKLSSFCRQKAVTNISPLQHSRIHHICIFCLQPSRITVASPQSICMLPIISDLFIDLHCYCHSLFLLYTSSFSYYTGFLLLVAHFFIIICAISGSVLFQHTYLLVTSSLVYLDFIGQGGMLLGGYCSIILFAKRKRQIK